MADASQHDSLSPQASEAPDRPELKRAIGRFGFFSLAFGSMIGVGWITGLESLFTQAGPLGTTIAFVAGGLLMIVIGLCYAEAMKVLPVTGGEVAYSYKAHGTGAAFLVGWCLAIGYLSVSVFEAVSIGIVFSYLIPFDLWPMYEINGTTVYGSHVLLALLFTSAIAWMNYRGVGLATQVQTCLTMLLILFTAAFVMAGFANGHVSHLAPRFGQSELALTGMLTVFVTVPFWFVGFDTIPQAAEERTAGLPPARLGKIMVIAIAGSTLFYVLVFLSVGLATPWLEIISQPLPTAVAFEEAFGSKFWSRLVLIVGLIGLLTSWNGFFLSGCRVLFALGRGHIIHSRFGRTSRRYGTPAAAILFSAILTFAGSFLGKPAILIFLNVGSLCIAVAFLGVACSIHRLRDPEKKISPFQRVLPYIAGAGSLFILAAMLVPGSPAMLPSLMEWVVLGVVFVLGLFFWYGGRRIRAEINQQQRHQLILDEID
ncbi:MAG: APC family permease [Mariniblastus sp.]|nr:APC family permease [Mariniblastus sp.]